MLFLNAKTTKVGSRIKSLINFLYGKKKKKSYNFININVDSFKIFIFIFYISKLINYKIMNPHIFFFGGGGGGVKKQSLIYGMSQVIKSLIELVN